MVNYEVTVSTAYHDDAGTSDDVFIKLVSFGKSSEHTRLIDLKGDSPFTRGAVCSSTVSCPASIGDLFQIQLNKQHLPKSPKDSKWFPTEVVVKSPEGNTYKFPIYQWIDDCEVHRFTEARVHVETTLQCGIINYFWPSPKNDYCWDVFEKGIPHHMYADSLPSGGFWPNPKELEFLYILGKSLLEISLKGLSDSKEDWPDIEHIKGVFCSKQTDISDYCQEHWKEDAFFGYQFLNGVNPMLIRRCSALPKNFPVTDNMVCLSDQCSLTDEMKKGNIFLCDYKSLDGLEPNTINGKKQYLMAPLVLLHKTPFDEMRPIAIQLKQTAAADNPIFCPTDSEYDWLMAKIFVRSADFNEHQLHVHLLRTHLLPEVFAVSLLRNVPEEHHLYKLLIPHTHYTLQINYKARDRLISETGVIKQIAASGGEGMKTLLKRSLASLTYSSLCVPEDIAERGLEAVPNFYYRDDGLKLWDIIHRFVQGVLSFYYKKDDEVQEDHILQQWIKEIFEHGFLSKAGTGIPQSFTTVAELVKFVTMVIFTCTGQHSAVNTGQYDYGGWMPNTPTTMRLPPPTTKGTTNEAKMLQTLPDKGTTAKGMAALWLLSKQFYFSIPLGEYKNDRFSEEIPCLLIRAFQGELQALSAQINIRNKNLVVPYRYMDPTVVETSVAL